MRGFKVFNGQAYAPLGYFKGGYQIHVRKEVKQVYDNFRAQRHEGYEANYFYNQIRSLNNGSSHQNSFWNRARATQRVLELEGGGIEYYKDGPNIFITDVIADASYGRSAARSGGYLSGLYEVNRVDLGKWAVEPEGIRRATSDFIAINGHFSSIDEVAKFMPAFIDRGYSKFKSVRRYNLYYNRTTALGRFLGPNWTRDSWAGSDGSQSAHKLCALIETHRHTPINWTIHEQGAAVFMKALQITKDRNIRDLSAHRVFYANATVNISRLDRLRQDVGMQLTEKNAMLQNDLSLSQSLLTGNYISQVGLTLTQRAEQGASRDTNTRSSDIGTMVWDKVGKPVTPAVMATAITSGTLPPWYALLFGWSVFAFQVAVASTPGANKYPITEFKDTAAVALERLGYRG